MFPSHLLHVVKKDFTFVITPKYLDPLFSFA